jgi:hypothetical protein
LFLPTLAFSGCSRKVAAEIGWEIQQKRREKQSGQIGEMGMRSTKKRFSRIEDRSLREETIRNGGKYHFALAAQRNPAELAVRRRP